MSQSYRARSAKGEVIMSPMSQCRIVHTPALLGSPVVFTGNALQCSGASAYQSIYEFPAAISLSGLTRFWFSRTSAGYPVWNPGELLSQSEIEGAIHEAATKCHNQRGRPTVTYWETIAERRQAYAMAGQYLRTLKQAVDGAYNDIAADSRLRRRLRGLGKVSRAATAGWLITRYGLAPLLSDLRSFVSQLKKDIEQVDRFTARGKATVGRSQTSLSAYIPAGNHIQCTYRYELTDEVTVRAMSLDEWRMTVLDHFGLDPKGLITLPWELLTLSFVADWFINVGDFLGSLVPLPGVKQLGSCWVLQRSRSLTATMSGFSGVGIAVVSSGGSAQKVGTIVERTRVNGLPGPQLRVLNRSMVNPNLDKNWQRQVDACALIGAKLHAISRL